VTAAAWDYLIVTASNEEQASAFRQQLELRKRLGFIPQAKEILAISDPGGKRVGSGGSTIHCLIEILNREIGGGGARDRGLPPRAGAEINDRAGRLEALKRLRILIVHAGGDSRRIPAYGPCGKVFIPVPGESDRGLSMTLLDRLLPTYLALPPGGIRQGQIVVTTGDVLLMFDPGKVKFADQGMTALGCFVVPELAANHGVICPDAEGKVRLFLQKPSPAEQKAKGALDRHGRAVLDIGVMSLDARTALELVDLSDVRRSPSGKIAWTGPMAEAIETRGLDFYREICCALGTETEFEDYVRSVRASGSKLEAAHLRRIFDTMSKIPFFLSALPECGFFHFGTSRELIRSGNDLLSMDDGIQRGGSYLSLNNHISGDGRIEGANAWVEGCRVEAPLTLGGENLVVGVDIRSPLALPPKSVLDVIKGKDKRGAEVWFVRCYGMDDVFHKPLERQIVGPAADSQSGFGAGDRDRPEANPEGTTNQEAKDDTRKNSAAGGGARSAELIEEKLPIGEGADSDRECARLAGMPLHNWLGVMAATADDLWDAGVPPDERLVWNARIFPAVGRPEDYREWLWMLSPEKATPEMKAKWRKAERYSFAEMLQLASQEDFHRRRLENRAEEMRRSLRRLFRRGSGFSASELAFILEFIGPEKKQEWAVDLLRLTASYVPGDAEAKKSAPGIEQLELARILHTLGSALLKVPPGSETPADRSSGDHVPRAREIRLPDRSGSKGPPGSPAGSSRPGDKNQGLAVNFLSAAYRTLSRREQAALTGIGLPAELAHDARTWALRAREKAFEQIGRTIVLSRERFRDFPKNSLRTDEIIWGRAPARLDLGGGWSDTPPYSLEHGGCVINAAVNLNGQPPIHAYARVIKEPEIHISSIDHGARIVIGELDELLDYRSPESEFGLAKATLALSGFSPEHADWPRGTRTLRDMLHLFGGGIELTTLAAIPSGSGLGTSSIMGAVLMAVVHRMAGRSLSPKQLFHNVLRLEQELTTGGGWQDQIGGALGGVKMITTEPDLVPDPHIRFVPDDVLNPRVNGGQTLLYYTGLRRLAKNILHYVVGNYLDRDREAMATLRRLHAFPPMMVEAMTSKDMKRFGELIAVAWNLNKDIDPDSTTPEIEAILERIRPHMHGAKLLGAGGGGFLLIVCKSPAAAMVIRADLEARPPNDRARFFDFDISPEGLAVTSC